MKALRFRRLIVFGVGVFSIFLTTLTFSHCQIPCGIYGDEARFDMIAENLLTIEKSMKQINELSKKDDGDENQIVRWVNNKEKHADDTSEIITDYFMAQRIKIIEDTESGEYKEYVKKVTLLHKMLVYSMKAKQSTDLANVKTLRELLEKFREAYFQKEDS